MLTLRLLRTTHLRLPKTGRPAISWVWLLSLHPEVYLKQTHESILAFWRGAAISLGRLCWGPSATILDGMAWNWFKLTFAWSWFSMMEFLHPCGADLLLRRLVGELELGWPTWAPDPECHVREVEEGGGARMQSETLFL